MPQSKALPKERYTRQRHTRSIRRTLASLNPSNSHPQQQSLLFSKLPAELRLVIFKEVLCETYDHNRPGEISPLYRPCYTQRTTISTALLLTCRLIYSETHFIPLRSATLLFRHLSGNAVLWADYDDSWLHHLTKSSGRELYHLHKRLVYFNKEYVTKHFLPHLKWKRVTWMVSSHLWPGVPSRDGDDDHDVPRMLAKLVLPDSCNEVTVEVEINDDDMWYRAVWWFWESVARCRQLVLKRSDGLGLEFDDHLSLQYMWVGPYGVERNGLPTEEQGSIDHHMVRLCWRDKQVARRAYMSYDRLDCLRLDGCPEVTRVMPLQ
jgi:hypothetical protein